MASLSPFLRAKYTHLFQKFYDSNKNGVVTHSDFTDLSKHLIRFHNWGPADAKSMQCVETLDKAWLALKATADVDRDQKITLEEWHAYWANFVKKSGGKQVPPDALWIKEYMVFWFNLMDTSGDGIVDETEYTGVCKHFGMSEGECKKSFAKFATQPVDKKYFEQLWMQYMTSEDKKSPGNYIFGISEW